MAAFAKSTTVSVSVQYIGGEFFHPIGRLSGIANNLLPSPSKVNNSNILCASVGCKPMHYKTSLTSALSTCTSLSAGSAITTSLIIHYNAQPYCMADMAAMGNFS